MKKSIKIVALALVAVMLCLSLVACGKKLSGTYEAQIGGDLLGYTASYKFSGSNIFYDILYQLHRKTHKYRRVAVSSHQGAIHSLEEHRKIFEAIAAHNEELASEVMIKHIQNAKARLVKKIEE